MATTDNKFTTIRILKETRDELNNIGHKSETHDDIIRRLIKTSRENEAKK